MRVVAYPADLGGCGSYRVIWPAQALQAQGADVELILPGEGHQMQALWEEDLEGTTRELRDIYPPDCDVVVLQRPLTRWMASAIPMIQAKGVRVVVEIDDDFSCIHPRNVSFRSVHPKHSPERNHQWLARACAVADLVVVTTPALARRYGRHGRVAVVPNYVPERYLATERHDRDGVYLGWTGSIETHPTDLQVTRGAVARVVAETGCTFAVVGTGKGVSWALDLAAPVKACGWVSIEDYPTAMAQLDVGIVPLDDIAFNQGKSWLKGLEMAAVGVPFVASPTEDYVRLAAEGAGELAARPRDWERHLRRLVGSAEARADAAGRGREVARRLTIEGNCGRWWEAWESALGASTTQGKLVRSVA